MPLVSLVFRLRRPLLHILLLIALICGRSAIAAQDAIASADANSTPPDAALREMLQSNATLTLASVLQLVDEANPQLLAARSGLAMSEADIRIAGEIPNPQLIGYVGFGRTTTVLGNPQQIGISQTIETAGKRKKRVLLAQAQRSLTAEQIQALWWDIRSQTRQAYTELAVAEANAKLLEAQADLLQQMVDIAQKRFDAGAAPKAEVLQAQLLRDQLDTQKTATAGRIRQARTQLNGLLGNRLPPDFSIHNNLLEIQILRTDLLPDASEGLPALDKLVALGYMRRPDLKTAQLQEKVARSQITLELAKRIPDLNISSGGQFISLSGKYSPTGKTGFFGGAYSVVTVDLPLFHQQQAEIARAEAQMSQAQLQMSEVQNRIRTEIQTAYELLQSNLENIQRYRQKLMPASADALKLAQTSYRYGKTNLASVILAQQADQAIRQGYLDTIANYQRTWGDLEKAIGEPIGP